jgi:hypothetical protein
MEIDFNMNDFKSMYGFICAIEQNDGKIAIAYAFHTLNFKFQKWKWRKKFRLDFNKSRQSKPVSVGIKLL